MSDFMKKGDKYVIHSYKHNGKLYKTWDEAIYLDECEDYYVFGNNHTRVTKKYGSSWNTREAAVMFFFKKEWFNVIAQLKSNGIYFYCNIASPVLIEEDTKTIKYIDYDLDLRIFPTGSFKILDKGEYRYHKNKMHYSKELDIVIRTSLSELIESYQNKAPMFNLHKNLKYREKYQEVSNLS